MPLKDIFDRDQNRTFVIAEIGSNHNQDINLAFETIDAAVACGADAVKFQSLSMTALYLQPDSDTRTLYRKIDLAEDWHHRLKTYCDRKNITFFSAPTYLKAIDILEEIGVELYKLASAQVGTFPQLVAAVAGLGKPVLLSTGLVTYAELEKTIGFFEACKNRQYVILHCNSIYPTPYDKVNLKLMDIYKAMFGNPVGFSDHTPGIAISLAAVARGASVIERHFTLDKKLPVPDAPISLDPAEFESMVTGIRAIEMSLQFKQRTDIEAEENGFKNDIRYRLILKTAKRPNSAFTETDFEFKRHPSGVDCRDMAMIVHHMQAKTDIPKGTLLTWEHLSGNTSGRNIDHG